MFNPIRRRLYAWHMRNDTRRRLAMLDNRILADMGIERDQIDDVIAHIDIEGDRK